MDCGSLEYWLTPKDYTWECLNHDKYHLIGELRAYLRDKNTAEGSLVTAGYNEGMREQCNNIIRLANIEIDRVLKELGDE